MINNIGYKEGVLIMNTSNIFIGGWFQRTMLQLLEIYDFFKEGKSQLDLDQEKLNELPKKLENIETIYPYFIKKEKIFNK